MYNFPNSGGWQTTGTAESGPLGRAKKKRRAASKRASRSRRLNRLKAKGKAWKHLS